MSLRSRPLFLGQAEDNLAHTADVVTLDSDAVGEVADTTIEEPMTTEDLVAAFHQASGGAGKHHQNENLGMLGEEEVEEEDQMAVGTDEEGEDGNLP